MNVRLSTPLTPAVVVPIRDEEALLPRCLRALSVAAAATRQAVHVVLVLDSCTDRTAEVVAALAPRLAFDLTVLTAQCGSVGVARAAGAAHLLDRFPAERLWLATTDADSSVCRHWLSRQLEYAAAGSALVAGTVAVDSWTGWPAPVRRSYNRRYAKALAVDGHGHIHGANLGIRGDVYRDLGGFPPLSTGEDVSLVFAAGAARVPIVWATDIPVRTSARDIGRAPDGFATTLNELNDLALGNEA
jgi:glycosyltransferase involved in cell wall biosynthesis